MGRMLPKAHWYLGNLHTEFRRGGRGWLFFFVGSLPLSLILRESLQPSRQVSFDVSDSDSQCVTGEPWEKDMENTSCNIVYRLNQIALLGKSKTTLYKARRKGAKSNPKVHSKTLVFYLSCHGLQVNLVPSMRDFKIYDVLNWLS